MLTTYAEQEPRLRVILQDENAGFAQGTNRGVEQARGDYLALLNVDTIVTWGWLERLLRHCRRDAGVGAVLPVTNWASNEARINVAYEHMAEMEEFAASLARRHFGQSLPWRRRRFSAPSFQGLCGTSWAPSTRVFGWGCSKTTTTRCGYAMPACASCARRIVWCTISAWGLSAHSRPPNTIESTMRTASPLNRSGAWNGSCRAGERGFLFIP